jgi:hypothetical protein
MTTSTVPLPTRQEQTAQLLRLMYDYMSDNAVTHSALMPALTSLADAASLFAGRSPDAPGKAAQTYWLINASRTADPALPPL